MNEVLFEIIDVKKALEIGRIFQNKINIENDSEIIENLKDEWYGDIWDLFYQAIENLDKKSFYKYQTPFGDVIQSFLSQLKTPPYRQHEMEKIRRKVLEEYFEKFEKNLNDTTANNLIISPPNIVFFVDKDGKRGWEVKEENIDELTKSIPGLEDLINELGDILNENDEDTDCVE